MTTLTVYTPAAAIAQPPPGAHPKAKLTTDDGLVLVLPFAPNEVDHDGIADEFATLARPGRKPLVVKGADGLRTMSFEVLLARSDHQAPVEAELAVLRRIAEDGDRVTVSLSALEAGRAWRLTGLSLHTTGRQHGTNAVTRATGSLTFTEVIDPVVNVGPLTGGKTGGKKKVRKTRHYIVKKGDRIARIALRFYGDPNGWHRIAKASKLKHPHKLKPGRRLTIPPNV